MIPAMVTIVGVGIVSFLLMLFAAIINKEGHNVLRLLTFFVALGLLIIIPKAAIDAHTVCETVVSNSTTVDNITFSYEYEDFCYDRTETTPETFNTAVLWFYRAFMAYVIIYLFYLAVVAMKESLYGKNKGGGL